MKDKEILKDREIALKILHTIDTKDAYSNLTINSELKDKNLSSLDRGFITELVYGTLENSIYICLLYTSPSPRD